MNPPDNLPPLPPVPDGFDRWEYRGANYSASKGFHDHCEDGDHSWFRHTQGYDQTWDLVGDNGTHVIEAVRDERAIPTPETDQQSIRMETARLTGAESVVTVDHARRLERQRDEAREILTATLKALPVGYLPAHTPESIPGRVADLVTRYAETEHQRDEWMDRTTDALAQVGNLTEHRDAYAETLREIDLSGLIGNTIRNRHPELAENDQIHPRRA